MLTLRPSITLQTSRVTVNILQPDEGGSRVATAMVFDGYLNARQGAVDYSLKRFLLVGYANTPALALLRAFGFLLPLEVEATRAEVNDVIAKVKTWPSGLPPADTAAEAVN